MYFWRLAFGFLSLGWLVWLHKRLAGVHSEYIGWDTWLGFC